MRIALKRIHDPIGEQDGYRALVDRIWPRGIAKRDAGLDEWCRTLAPSTELRRWFGHAPERWDGFRARYRAELEALAEREPIERLRARARAEGLTLLFAARDRERNNAVVLKQYLEEGG